MQSISRINQVIFWVIVLICLILLYLSWNKNIRTIYENRDLREKLQLANIKIIESHNEIGAMFQLSQKFVEASDEREVIEFLLHLSIDLVGASGASYVPLDDRGQPITVYSKGDLPFPVVNDWVEYLASPSIRNRCQSCQSLGEITTSCPLLIGPYSDAIGMFCLPLRRGSREYGILNLYLPSVSVLEFGKQTFLKAMIDETALALEGIRLRSRELEGLRHMQSLRQKDELSQILQTLLDNTGQMLQADFTCLVIYSDLDAKPRINLCTGDDRPEVQHLIDGILKGVVSSGQPVILGDISVEPASNRGVKSILATPCVREDKISGAILTGSQKQNVFNTRQMHLLQAVADQVIQIIDNADQITNLEYKAMMNERTRLAREIHDGLAQTLGFLKLQISQMRNYVATNDQARLQDALEICYSTISDAYTDARQAIDGLRIWPHQLGMNEWIIHMCREFEETSKLEVDVEIAAIEKSLAPEIHAQLIRIVQESLSNVRKHSNANYVKVKYVEDEGAIWLEISDNGIGFSPEDVSVRSQYGLRGMRERAELIGADYQIISQEGKGTSVQLHLPLQLTDKEESA
jgi:two-component system, NarL family, nitrate/nitrite sensor histidine kinase NarX